MCKSNEGRGREADEEGQGMGKEACSKALEQERAWSLKRLGKVRVTGAQGQGYHSEGSC